MLSFYTNLHCICQRKSPVAFPDALSCTHAHTVLAGYYLLTMKYCCPIRVLIKIWACHFLREVKQLEAQVQTSRIVSQKLLIKLLDTVSLLLYRLDQTLKTVFKKHTGPKPLFSLCLRSPCSSFCLHRLG